jgi:hypothetical protein
MAATARVCAMTGAGAGYRRCFEVVYEYKRETSGKYHAGAYPLVAGCDEGCWVRQGIKSSRHRCTRARCYPDSAQSLRNRHKINPSPFFPLHLLDAQRLWDASSYAWWAC